MDRIEYDTPLRGANSPGEVSDDLLARVISVLKAGIRYAGPADGAGVRHLSRLVEELERVQAAR